ncbi:MAG: metal-dependent hydrolase [Proteobacteria bacterium]|nr:metal-dependent hydrolase [Pseudomonadota bacterium]
MDPFSHALVGGTFAAASRYTPHIRAAVLCGVVAGMMPDIDVLLRETGNPMLGLGLHRHFTHALVFVPFGALIIASFLWLFLKSLPMRFLYFYSFMGILTHGILDSLTNYGTHWLWPFTNRRESWSVISIVDPIFTFTLLGLLIASAVQKTRRYVLIGVAFAGLYLGFGLYQRGQATEAMMAQAQARGHDVVRYEVKPSIGNLFAWRGQYEHAGRVYVDAYHVSPWRGHVVYEGGSLPLYKHQTDVGPLQQKDFEYFEFFSDGWVARAPSDQNLLGDIRFSMLPNSLEPIWGIKFQSDPAKHVLFENVRSRKEGDFARLWAMIKGEPLP